MHRVVVVSVVLAFAAPAAADTCDDEAAALRAHLDEESHRAHRWNTVWAILFGASAVGQVALAAAEVNPTGEFDRDFEETLYVGAVKASIGFGSKLAMPLRIPSPPPASGDACADVAALHATLGEAARRERNSFWLTHLGGIAVNLAGATVLTVRRSLPVGALSFVVSFPVSTIAAYTQPRRSWHMWRERRASWTVGATATGGGAQLWLGGEW